MLSEMITFLSAPVGKLNEHRKTLSCHLLQNPRYHTVASHRKNRRPCILSCPKWDTNASRAHRDGRFYSPEKSRKRVTLLDTSVMKHLFGCDTPEVSKIEHLKQNWTINSLEPCVKIMSNRMETTTKGPQVLEVCECLWSKSHFFYLRFCWFLNAHKHLAIDSASITTRDVKKSLECLSCLAGRVSGPQKLPRFVGDSWLMGMLGIWRNGTEWWTEWWISSCQAPSANLFHHQWVQHRFAIVLSTGIAKISSALELQETLSVLVEPTHDTSCQ